MEKIHQIQRLLLRSRRLPGAVIGLALLILAGAILTTTWQLRKNIRLQIAGRDGEVLHAVALMEYADDVEQGLAGPITDPGSQLGIVLKTARLKGVLGICLYDAAGQFVETFPPDVREWTMAAGDLPALQELRPVSHFHPAIAVSDLFMDAPARSGAAGRTVPLLEVNVPLHAGAEGRLAGIARFLIEGNSIAAEYARLDRHLALQAVTALAVGGGLLSLAIGWAFRRLRQAHRTLADRTQDLIKANQELVLAAKTSALGTVAAHLIHGLKNPLVGLQSFVAAHSARSPLEGMDWEQAASSTRRMHDMISQVVEVLREEQVGTHYEVSLEEVADMVEARVRPLVRQTGVQFQKAVKSSDLLPNHVAHLTALILVNLVQNALQATPAGRTVRLDITRAARELTFEVADEGPGFPASQTPFAPCHSEKEGGSGIGLALSKQLANHLGGTLALKRSTPGGCAFALGLSASLCVEKSNAAVVSVVG